MWGLTTIGGTLLGGFYNKALFGEIPIHVYTATVRLGSNLKGYLYTTPQRHQVNCVYHTDVSNVSATLEIRNIYNVNRTPSNPQPKLNIVCDTKTQKLGTPNPHPPLQTPRV